MQPTTPPLLLHVGAVPTASWVAQQSLLRNAAAWRERGVHCLPDETLVEVLGSGNRLVDEPERLAAALRAAAAEPGVDVVVGSREILGPALGGPTGGGIHGKADATIRALGEFGRSHPTRVVLSVCPQAELLDALYDRAVKSGGSATFDEWLAGVDLDDLSWLPIHRALCDALGADSVHVIEFHRTLPGHQAFVRALLALAGQEVPKDAAARIPRPDRLLSDKGHRLALATNPFVATARERGEIRTFLRTHFSELDGPVAMTTTAEQQEQLADRYDGELQFLLGADRSASGGRR